ncbi:MAG: hypothetical protein HDS59_02680 [Barnesiella sp.]|nr:hypothetical protein [Barnesiella sp.]
MNTPFSQRNGYVKAEKVLIREQLTGTVLNAVMNATSDMFVRLNNPNITNLGERLINEFKLKYLNLRYEQMQYYNGPIEYIDDEEKEWYYRLDVIEWVISQLRLFIHDMYQNSQISNRYVKNAFESVLENYINSLNKELERLNYGYRIIGDVFVEITSSSEMAVIQESLQEADTNTVTHLQESLKLLSPSNQELSTRNAIKEAISAVEVTARQITNTSTLDEAFKKLRDIHPMIKLSMEKLYHYTNQKDTGIRHGWMEQSYEPTINEAIFVLVTSCSFINYLNKVCCNA